MPLELIIDGLLALLMVGVILSAYLLNQRISNLRRGQEEMLTLVEKLDAVTNSAQASIEELKQLGGQTQKQFSEQMNKARGLADELSVMTQAGDNLADRLDKKISQSREARPQTNEKKSVKQPAMPQEFELDEEQTKVLDALKLAR